MQHGGVPDIAAPFDVYRSVVRPEWIDFNGHFNAGYYMVVFDDAISPWMDFIGLGDAHREREQVTTFSAESHITYVREVGEGTELSVTTQLLAFDRKRIHAIQIMHDLGEGFIAATNEVMSLHVSEKTRKVSEMHDDVYDRLGQVWRAHEVLSIPPQVGKVMTVPGWKGPDHDG